jgi:hypothetical protein
MEKLAKNSEKTVKKGEKSGGEWRFSESSKRHFAVPRASGPGSEAAALPTFTSVDVAGPQPPATRQIGSRAPFFILSVVVCPLSVARSCGWPRLAQFVNSMRFAIRIWLVANG